MMRERDALAPQAAAVLLACRVLSPRSALVIDLAVDSVRMDPSWVFALIERLGKQARRPLVRVACKVAGVDAAREHRSIENERLLRDNELKLCDELDAATADVERLGPLVAMGRTTNEWDKWSASYATATNRLRDVHPDIAGLIDDTGQSLLSPEQWQGIVRMARPTIAARRRKALGG
jgi:hypothetical protein